MDSCFICLENSIKKICKTCNIRCHDECWKQYCQHNVKLERFDNCIVIPLTASCPQCKKDINRLKAVTRSDTKKLRLEILSDEYTYIKDNLCAAIEIYKSQQEKNMSVLELIQCLYDILYDILYENIDLFKSKYPKFTSKIPFVLKHLSKSELYGSKANIWLYKFKTKNIY